MMTTNLNVKQRKPLKTFIMTVLLFITLVASTQAEEVYFTTMPTISPDASKIVFSYEGDLWMVNIPGGTAFRLTGMEGEETLPHFSPDGKWIAFSGTQEGNPNVYVMPAVGGEIKQLTYHDARDYVDSWSWNSNHIYFNSNRCNTFTTFKVSREGGTPQRLFPHYFNTIHNVVEHPISKAYYFTDTWESHLEASRKGYKGEYNPDIKLPVLSQPEMQRAGDLEVRGNDHLLTAQQALRPAQLSRRVDRRPRPGGLGVAPRAD